MGKFTKLLNDAKAYYADKPDSADFQNRFFSQDSPYMLELKTQEERKELTSSPEYKAINRMIEALEAGEKEYKGDFLVRTAPSVHRALAMEAALEGISLNQLCEIILSVGLGRALAKTNR